MIKKGLPEIIKEKDFYSSIQDQLTKEFGNDIFTMVDEFGIPETKRRVDVFCCRWDPENQRTVQTFAIEVKYLPEKKESKNPSRKRFAPEREFAAGLPQAIDSLPFFSFVALATPKSNLPNHWKHVAKLLNISHVTFSSPQKNRQKVIQVNLPEWTEIPKVIRYNEGYEKVQQRAKMVLTFRDLFAEDNEELEFGEFRKGRGWIAKNLIDKSKRLLQVNSVIVEEEKIALGINIEWKQPFVTLLGNFTEEHAASFHNLCQKHQNLFMSFSFDRRPPPTISELDELTGIIQKYSCLGLPDITKHDEITIWAQKALFEISKRQIECLISVVREVLKKPNYWRPHLTIYTVLESRLTSKERSEQVMKNAYVQLDDFERFFTELLD